jgi:hypothetical protein
MGFGEFLKSEKEKARSGFEKIKKDYTEKQMVNKWKNQELKSVEREETWKERVKLTKKQAREKTRKKYGLQNKGFVSGISALTPKVTKSSGFTELPGKKKKGGSAFDF